jgi:hypothetical protein
VIKRRKERKRDRRKESVGILLPTRLFQEETRSIKIGEKRKREPSAEGRWILMIDWIIASWLVLLTSKALRAIDSQE